MTDCGGLAIANIPARVKSVTCIPDLGRETSLRDLACEPAEADDAMNLRQRDWMVGSGASQKIAAPEKFK